LDHIFEPFYRSPAVTSAQIHGTGLGLPLAQSMAEAMRQGDGDGQQDGPGPGNRAGRQQSGGNQTDPLGRPLHGREFGDDLTVKIPGEIDVQRVRRILEELRRRLADPARPQIELDYIERLLKDY